MVIQCILYTVPSFVYGSSSRFGLQHSVTLVLGQTLKRILYPLIIFQRLELLKELREMISIADNNKETKQLPMAGGDTGVYNVIPQKRFRPFRTQTRAGEPGKVYIILYYFLLVLT